MHSNEVTAILNATDLEALHVAGAAALDPFGPYRIEIDGVPIAGSDTGLPYRCPLPVLPGSSGTLWCGISPPPRVRTIAQIVATTHIRLVLQEQLERRVLLSARHLHAVERTVAFLGLLREDEVRLDILAACMEVVDASVGSLLERTANGWSPTIDMGLPRELALLARSEPARLALLRPEGIPLLQIPLGPTAVAFLGDWSMADGDALAVLETVARLGEVALDNARLVREAEERQRLEMEMAFAGRTQSHLLPPGAPRWPGLDVAGHSRPSATCGGDYYDWFDLPDGSVAFVVADVSGHGVGAALLMATLRGYLRASLLRRPVLPPDRTLADVGTMLGSILEPWQFVTVFLGRIAPDRRTLCYANAGHEAGLLHRTVGSLDRLTAGGPPLGIDPALVPTAHAVELRPGDALVVPTDGLAEAVDPRGIPVGRDRLEQWFCALAAEHSTSANLRDALLAQVDAHRSDADRQDDETLVVIRTTGEERSP